MRSGKPEMEAQLIAVVSFIAIFVIASTLVRDTAFAFVVSSAIGVLVFEVSTSTTSRRNITSGKESNEQSDRRLQGKDADD